MSMSGLLFNHLLTVSLTDSMSSRDGLAVFYNHFCVTVISSLEVQNIYPSAIS